jgi:molecular chaperone HtpG
VEHQFRINLRGLIDLLSNHLYSGPQVYLRELLQNAVDALRARTDLEPGHRGEVAVEVVPGRGGKPPTLAFVDNGVGLSEDEVQGFLATIGQSSKRAWEAPADFLGRFGIGLLSCFVVSEEVVVITRSARGGRATEWRGRADGTCSLKPLDGDVAAGTQIYLACKPGCEEWFEPARVADLATHFGALLPYPVRVTTGKQSQVVSDGPAPWRRQYASREEQSRAMLEYGRRAFGIKFFDWVPLRSEAGAVDGVAFVLPCAPGLATRKTHRVYLKDLLLSESAEDLLPEWAFFVKCVVNANDLRPTASRESFCDDDKLRSARAALGGCLRDYLVGLARRAPRRLRRFLALHALSIKALAVQDEEAYRLFIDWLPFETSLGEMTLGEYRREYPVVRYVPTLDRFRQLARVAAAQGVCVINAGYVYDAELLARLPEVLPPARVETLDPATLARGFEELSPREHDETAAFLRAADRVLRPFQCTAEIKKFLPRELPTLFSAGKDAEFLRSVEQAGEVSDELWSSILDNLAERPGSELYARLCFNFNSPLVRKMVQVKDPALLQRSVQLLYVQSLLLGHHPLNAKEMALLNEGLLGLIEWGVDAQE